VQAWASNGLIAETEAFRVYVSRAMMAVPTALCRPQQVECEKDLANLTPKGRLITAKPFEGSVVEIGKT
jgi:hypothetical protein